MARQKNTNKTTNTNTNTITNTAADLAAEALTQPAEQHSLASLTLSPLNPRQEVAAAELDALTASIRTLGLLQSLAGQRQEDGSIAIVAGGRRLRALTALAAEQGADPANLMVPVIVTERSDIAHAWASAENVVRAPLNAAEEIRAFGTMQAAGQGADAIARAFGTTLRHVKGRLKLAHLPAVILTALEAEDITLDMAQAYAIADDPAQAEAVYDALKDNTWGHSAHEIRARLTQDSTDGTNRIARFVGRDAYEAAGGAIVEDLFGEESILPIPTFLPNWPLIS